MTLALVAAVAANGVIGHAGGLPWHLPADLAHFKRLTLGHPMVMGRLTYESIGRPLPGRTSIVITRSPTWTARDVVVVRSLEEALAAATAVDDDIFVIGGEQVFRAALPLADRLHVTHLDSTPDGDRFFPEIDAARWREVSRDAGDGYAFVDYARR